MLHTSLPLQQPPAARSISSSATTCGPASCFQPGAAIHPPSSCALLPATLLPECSARCCDLLMLLLRLRLLLPLQKLRRASLGVVKWRQGSRQS